MTISGDKKAPATDEARGLGTRIDGVQFVKAIISRIPTELNKIPQHEKRGQRRASSLLIPVLFRWVFRGVKSKSNTGLKIRTSASQQALILFAGVNSLKAVFFESNLGGLRFDVPMYNNGTFTHYSTPQRGNAC